MAGLSLQPVGYRMGDLMANRVHSTDNYGVVFSCLQDERGGSTETHALHGQEANIAIIDFDGVLMVPVSGNDCTSIVQRKG